MEGDYATPYYAVSIETSELRDDVMYRVMTEKVMDLAAEQAGYLYADWVVDESAKLVFYWRKREQAEAWMNHSMMLRVLSIGGAVLVRSLQLEVARSAEGKSGAKS